MESEGIQALRLFPHKSVVKLHLFPHKSVVKLHLFPHKSVVKLHLFPHKSVKYLHISLIFSNFALMKRYIYKDLLKWKDSRRFMVHDKLGGHCYL